MSVRCSWLQPEQADEESFFDCCGLWNHERLLRLGSRHRALARRHTFRTYALKAAEKVTNLSKELSRLSTYLQEELQYTEYRSAEEELFAKEGRIESAIHILGSLPSINDTSLSEWQEVIGAELDEQRQTEEVRAEALGELTDRLAALERASTENVPVTEDLEIKALKCEVRALVADINGISFRPKRARPPYK